MKVILVRHGEPNYEEVRKWGNIGLGFELGKLSELGVKQAHEVSNSELFEDADLIISSPYTRSLQTAAIISKNINVDLEVETELHEWFTDTSMIFDYEVSDSYNAYINSRGIITKDEKFRFEEYAVIKKRVTEAILKYKYLNKIIVVCHGIVMSSMTHFDDLIEHCGTREIEL